MINISVKGNTVVVEINGAKQELTINEACTLKRELYNWIGVADAYDRFNR